MKVSLRTQTYAVDDLGTMISVWSDSLQLWSLPLIRDLAGAMYNRYRILKYLPKVSGKFCNVIGWVRDDLHFDWARFGRDTWFWLCYICTALQSQQRLFSNTLAEADSPLASPDSQTFSNPEIELVLKSPSTPGVCLFRGLRFSHTMTYILIFFWNRDALTYIYAHLDTRSDHFSWWSKINHILLRS